MDEPLTAAGLRQSLGSAQPPLLIDVRKQPTFLGAGDMIRGALRRDPAAIEQWKQALPETRDIVVYCVHGHEVSQNAAKALGARFLEGGFEAWRAAGGELSRKPAGASSRWITRERPKIDRIACPWLVRRFIDPDAEFLYAPTSSIGEISKEKTAIAFDIPDTEFSHEGERCSFDAFLKAYRLGEPALDELATIVRGADTGRLELAPQAAGLLAVSLGLSRNHPDDHEMLEHGMVVYDALYAWCRNGKEETHTWNPSAYK
jgi:rhodanese-related sulfurtransferase